MSHDMKCQKISQNEKYLKKPGKYHKKPSEAPQNLRKTFKT